ncbi:hypothetical protein AAMO2058_001572000 [Amorphochlora amoebiformis]
MPVASKAKEQWGLTDPQKKLVRNAITHVPEHAKSSKWKWIHEITFASEDLKGAATMPPSVNVTNSHRRSTWPSPLKRKPRRLQLRRKRQPALTPVTSAKRHRELAELEELAHIQSIVNKGDPPFIFIADRTKQKDAPLDGIGMWFNKGNNSMNVQLTVIHEIRMVHVQNVI